MSESTFIINNVNLCDVMTGDVLKNRSILVEQEKIAEIFESESPSALLNRSMVMVEGNGAYAIPGLWESHCHLGSLTAKKDIFRKKFLEEFESSEENWDTFVNQQLKSFVSSGITNIRDVGGPLEGLEELGMLTKSSNGYPSIFYAGPMLEKSPLLWAAYNEETPGFTVSVDSKEDARAIVNQLEHHGASLVKTFNKFDQHVYAFLLELATEKGLPVTHDPGSPLYHHVPMDIAIDFGIRCFEHGKAPWPVVLTDDLKIKHDAMIMNTTDPDERERIALKIFERGIDSIDSLKLEKLIEKMLEKNVFFCPTLHVGQRRVHDNENNDDISAEEKKQAAIFAHMIEVSNFLTTEMVKHNVPILVGHDGLNPAWTWEEMRLLRKCGLSPLDIIRGATIYPAQWLGKNELGTISPGKKADILLLTKNPFEDIHDAQSISCVIHAGEIVVER